MTSSTVSSESAPRSSTKDAFGVTSSSLTPSCSTTIFLTRSSMLLMWVNLRGQSPRIVKESEAPCQPRPGRSRGGWKAWRVKPDCARWSAAAFNRSLGHVHAAVYMQRFAGDVIRGRRSQVRDRLGNVGRRAQPAERDRALQRLALVFRERAGHVGINETRRNHIDGDAARTNLARQRFGERDDAGLGRGVV